MKNVKELQEIPVDQVSAFPVPFSLESFRNDIVEVYVHYVRTVSRMIDSDKANNLQLAWSITGQHPTKDSGRLCDQDYSAYDLGLRYEHIRESMFAHCMESLYEYAFNGRLDPMAEVMDYESSYMWVADLAMDALHSNMSEQWDSYGGSIMKEAANCVSVVETANARCILENGKYFTHQSNAKGNEDFLEDSLTIRQMALLSGMEEMSIRSAANPKRANPLKTFTAEKNGTRVDINVAKEWLKLKGRYVPVTIYSNSTELNLSRQKFSSYIELVSALEARIIVIVSRIGEEQINKQLEYFGIRNHPLGEFDRRLIAMNANDFLNENLITKIAELLELPGDLLLLRCKQTAAHEQLLKVERQLKLAVEADQLRGK